MLLDWGKPFLIYDCDCEYRYMIITPLINGTFIFLKFDLILKQIIQRDAFPSSFGKSFLLLGIIRTIMSFGQD